MPRCRDNYRARKRRAKRHAELRHEQLLQSFRRQVRRIARTAIDYLHRNSNHGGGGPPLQWDARRLLRYSQVEPGGDRGTTIQDDRIRWAHERGFPSTYWQDSIDDVRRAQQYAAAHDLKVLFVPAEPPRPRALDSVLNAKLPPLPPNAFFRSGSFVISKLPAKEPSGGVSDDVLAELLALPAVPMADYIDCLSYACWMASIYGPTLRSRKSLPCHAAETTTDAESGSPQSIDASSGLEPS